MKKHQVLDEFSFDKKEKLSFVLKIAFLVLLVVALGVYVGDLLFGKNSLEVLLNLQEKKAILKREIESYKKNNAILQKNYFELLQLEPDNG
ncbi:MAG: septum formation initiator [Epsilonproteobacteria bacterium]|nr:septum formation initiator [Campylobacterota bacterium]